MDANPYKHGFYLPGRRNEGILLIHGLTSNPSTLFYTGEELNKEGYYVYAPCLPGHGTTPHNLMKTSWADWENEVSNGIKLLKKTCESIYIIGLSLGANLALNAGLQYPGDIKKIVAISTPIYLRKEWYIRLMTPIHKKFKDFHPKPMSEEDIEYYIKTSTYDVWPYATLLELLKGMDFTKKIIPKVQTPTCVIYSKEDPIIHPASGKFIIAHLKSFDREKNFIELSGRMHMPFFGEVRDSVILEIKRFLKE